MIGGVDTPRFIIVGCGYTGQRLLPALSALGPVIATTSAAPSSAALIAAGNDARPWDLDRAAAMPLAAEEVDGSIMACLFPPPRTSDRDTRMQQLLTSLAAQPRRIVYVSTVGVYGDRQGERVTEDTVPQPQTPRATRRLDAETRLRAYCSQNDVEWVILRVPAIYGPGRLPVERIRRGIPTLTEAQAGPGNRIHVDDLVLACVAAATRPQAANRIFNISDGDPLSTTAFIAIVARLSGLPTPPAVPLEALRQQLPPTAISFLEESRLVDATRMREVLGVQPHYPKAVDGIQASLGKP